MKTKYLIMLMVACIWGLQTADAQNRPNGKRGGKRMTMEEMAEMQARRIVDDLGLDDKTSAKFTDMYKKYLKELNDVRKAMRPKQAGKDADGKVERKMANMTDEEVDKMMRDRFAVSRKVLDIREKFYDEFRKFLSPKQVEKVYSREMNNHGKFHKEMNRRTGMKRGVK